VSSPSLAGGDAGFEYRGCPPHALLPTYALGLSPRVRRWFYGGVMGDSALMEMQVVNGPHVII